MGKYATKEQLTALVADMASKINIASGTQGVSGSYVPIGCIEAFMGVEAPPDFLVCDGSLHSIASYPQLADHFYEQFGASNYFGGNGTTTFGVPNSTEWDTPTVPPNDTPVLWCIKAIDTKFDPEIQMVKYSTEEQLIGTWIDGKKLYQRTYDCGAGPNATTKSVPLGFTNYDHIYSIEGIVQYTNLKSYNATPIVHNSTISRQLNVAIYDGAIKLQGGSFDFSQYDKIYITIKYTKTTD